MKCNHQCPNICHVGDCPDPKICDKKVYLKCPCKRRKKETKCCEKQAGETLECDDMCKKVQSQKKQVLFFFIFFNPSNFLCVLHLMILQLC